ncbi:A/G-specific adenine glycosylase [Candidatus Viridilinea mediisalina]|uniref:Fe-S cluster assembly protein HesB n=1 Tax=Candidatus Viridilinea mediisalina TaxID=2024553 RepID=A0A2A6RIX2_9CHLR|nr:A/G-specific adenine glycosylase [Candidatus Viridilinea mediisalina]PDW02846.1 Fe-S cluster assembly protein HesB [Candidatus Viridilinea mediisalina]
MIPSLLTDMPAQLLAWFAAYGRDLPWRHTRDPYQILVAEIMLQQTQVERVISKYAAFLAAFPHLEALAAASVGDVIRHWAGLGYNRRAVNLQRSAKALVEQYGGQFPREVALLRQLPGLGPYTAGAVACFAFEQDVVFVDTNMRRVLRRTHMGADEATTAPPDRELLRLSAALLPAGQGWAWNQALIELGALRCRAQRPTCPQCPLQSTCRASAMWRNADQALLERMEQGQARPTTPLRRAAEGRASYRSSEPFVGSNRWYRGRIIDLLRDEPAQQAVALSELGPRLRADFRPSDMPWLEELVAGLARDGLVFLEGGTVRLP